MLDNPIRLIGDLVQKFIKASEVAFEKLSQMSLKEQRQEFKSPELAEVCRFPNFDQYLIFYRPVKGEIEILRVLHERQNVDAIMNDESED